MSHALAQAVEVLTTVLAVDGICYFLVAVMAAWVYAARRRPPVADFSPGVSILKSLKGMDPAMLDAFRSHCRQTYRGEFELLFGVSSLEDPAASAVARLQVEFPGLAIRLIECPGQLGTNGKVSTLIQLVPHARFEYLLINDSDITVSPRYVERVMTEFAPRPAKPEAKREVGLVTALYRGRAHGTLGSRLEALGITTDFLASVLVARWFERGMRYGLGSTLAVRRDALETIGGLDALADQLADDYELGARLYRAGYRIAVSREVVETSVPAYTWQEFLEHQLRWYRTVRDARPWGYAGLIGTYGIGWALLNVVASGVSPLSVWLLALSFFLRLGMAMAVGTQVLGDHQVLPALWLLPLRDLVALGLWVGGFAGNTIVWRGERFAVRRGRLEKAG